MELETALDVALKKHESELRDMEIRKSELQEMSRQQPFRPSDEFVTFKIIKNVKDLIAVVTSTVTSLEERFLWVAPGPVVVIASLYGINEVVKKLVERGGQVRGICDISHPIIEAVQELLDIDEDVRHFDQYQGIYLGVFDSKSGMSSINADFTRISLDEPVTALYADDQTFANYLASTFELLWEQAVPAAQRIEELLKAGPPPV